MMKTYQNHAMTDAEARQQDQRHAQQEQPAAAHFFAAACLLGAESAADAGRLRVVLRCRILFVISFVQSSFPAPPSARSFVQSCSAAACRCARLESLRST